MKCSALTVVSGVTSITGTVDADCITLGCADSNDRITIGGFGEEFESASIAGDQTLIDGVREYTGTLNGDDLADMAGKTLMKAHEHAASDLDFVQGVPAACDPLTGEYTNGTAAHYHCDICGGNFVEVSGSLERLTSVSIPYFTFWKMPAVQGVCYLKKYNGADADVVIPETVPESLDPSLEGTTITHIDSEAFAGHPELQTVTAGSGLKSIGAGAFAGCTLLKDFCTTAAQRVSYVYDDQNGLQDSFDGVTGLTIHATHASELYSAVKDYKDNGFTFVPTDRHPDPTWEWKENYSGATAHFACPTCPYKEDIYAVADHPQNDNWTVTVTTPDNYTYTDTRDNTYMFVPYIDKDGNDATADSKLITGTETSLGKAGTETWYVADGNFDFNNADLTLNGDTNIILADGATLTGVGTISSADKNNPVNLHIYGQSGQSGTMVADTLKDLASILYGGSLTVDKLNANFILWNGSADAGTVNSEVLSVTGGSMKVEDTITASDLVGVSGGSLDAGSITTKDLTVLQGSLTVTDVTVSGITYFTGGNTTVSGTANVNTVYLGCNSAADSITVGKYVFNGESVVFYVISEETLVDGLYTYSGILTNDDAFHMAGRTLVLAHEHSAVTLTPQDAVPPSYDSNTDTYTNGHIACYTCDTCGGYLVENGTGDFVYIAPAAALVPYLVFESNAEDAGCKVVGYNGADAEVVIPNVVPDNYTDSTLVGKAVTIIGNTAFKGTSVTNVTAGDNLTAIDTGAFEGCTALTDFTSSSMNAIQCSDDPFPSSVVLRGPHGGGLLAVANTYGHTFVPTDRHSEPTWTWASDYSSATATFDCNGTCQLAAPNNTRTDNSPASAAGDKGMIYTASVTVDGKTYTDVKNSSFWKELQAEINSKPDGEMSEITLSHDIIADTGDVPLVIPEGKIITLKLGKFKIDRNLNEAVENGCVITNNGTLTLTGSGTVTGGKNTESGGAIVNNGTLDLSGITISGNVSLKDGGAVYNSGTLNLNGGTISGNSAGSDSSGSGGAISAHKGTITISSGEIKNNTAASHGGAIYLGAKDSYTAALNLNGGTITGNTAGNQGGGILHNGLLSVKGSPVVKNNTALKGSNIYLRPSMLINVTDSLSGDCRLGVTRENNAAGVITSGLNGAEISGVFTSDVDGYIVRVNSDGEAELAVAPKPEFKTQSLTLSGQIGVNFFMDLSALADQERTNSYMTFTVGNSTSAQQANYNESFKDQTSGVYYGFTCGITSVQMADTITAVFHYGNGLTVENTYSVASYIEYFDEHQTDYNTKTLALIKSIADYGHYSQPFLAAANDWEVGTDHVAMTKFYKDSYNYTDIADAISTAGKVFSNTVDANAIEVVSYSMDLNSDTVMNVFIKPKAGYTVNVSATFKDETYNGELQSDGRYRVRIPGISAHLLGEMLKISGTATNGADSSSITINVSPLSYVYAVLTGGDSFNKAAKDAMSAFYSYYDAVIEYNKSSNS